MRRLRRVGVVGLAVAVLAAGAALFGQDEHAFDVQAQNGVLRGLVQTRLQSGGIVPQAGMSVYLLRQGQIVQSAVTAANGQFEFHAVGPGVYSVAGYGEKGLFAFGIRIAPDRESQLGVDQVSTLAVPAEDHPAVFRIIQEEMSGAVTVPRLSQAAEALREALAEQPTATAISSAKTVVVPPSPTVLQRPVRLGPNGELRGRVHLLGAEPGTTVEGLSVFLIRRGETLARGAVNADGTFLLPNVSAGIGSVVVAGRPGFGAVQCELVRAVRAAEGGTVPAKAVSLAAQGDANELTIGLIPPQDAQSFVNSLPPSVFGGLQAQVPPPVVLPNVPPPLPFGAGPGGVFGGGGGGIGALGALGFGVGVAGLATGVAALSQEKEVVRVSPF